MAMFILLEGGVLGCSSSPRADIRVSEGSIFRARGMTVFGTRAHGSGVTDVTIKS